MTDYIMSYKDKYILTKRKYIKAKSNVIQGGAYDIPEHVLDMPDCQTLIRERIATEAEIINTFDAILQENRATDFLSSGTTKIVYNVADNKKVLKIVIVPYTDNVLLALQEPIFMKKSSDICNTPEKITVYGKFEEKKSSADEDFNVKRMDIPFAVLSWFEPKATKTFPFSKEDKRLISTFIKDTKKKLKEFTDLGEQNVAFFGDEIKWIDLQLIQ